MFSGIKILLSNYTRIVYHLIYSPIYIKLLQSDNIKITINNNLNLISICNSFLPLVILIYEAQIQIILKIIFIIIFSFALEQK